MRQALQYTAQNTPPAFPELTQHLDSTWVEEALLATDTPAEQAAQVARTMQPWRWMRWHGGR